MSCNKKVLIPCITPSLKSPLPSIHVSTSTMGGRDAQASLTNYFWSMWEEKRGRYHTRMRDLTKWDGMIHMWESVTHFTRWHWMSCCWAGGPVWPFPLPTFLKSRRQSPSLVFPMAPMSLAVFFFFLWVKCWWIPCSSHRSKRGSNGLDYDSKRWLWGHCLDTAGSSEQPQPLPPLVSLFLFSPVRHCVSSGPSLLMESR